MFIQTEATPNPATLKFIPGKPVLPSGTRDYREVEAAGDSPLATRLFEIDGVTGVFFGSDFISVTKDEGEWQHLKPAVLGAIMEHYLSGAPVIEDGGAEGASDEEFFEKVEYIHRNPWKRGLVGDASDWEWSSASAYRGDTSTPVPIDWID